MLYYKSCDMWIIIFLVGLVDMLMFFFVSVSFLTIIFHTHLVVSIRLFMAHGKTFIHVLVKIITAVKYNCCVAIDYKHSALIFACHNILIVLYLTLVPSTYLWRENKIKHFTWSVNSLFFCFILWFVWFLCCQKHH